MKLSGFLNSDSSRKPFLALLGHPVSHSTSPGIHNLSARECGLEVSYHALDCPAEEWHLIPRLFELPAFFGANITIPLKKTIRNDLDGLDPAARKIGAVNTVVPYFLRSGIMTKKSLDEPLESARFKIGYNTDVYGFLKPLSSGVSFPVAAILGSGGASLAVCHALLNHGSRQLLIASRRPPNPCTSEKNRNNIRVISYSELEEKLDQVSLVVNTTPAGMYPEINQMPISERLLPRLRGKTVYDIIYNPPETRFLRESKKYDAQTIGGLEMFIYQASKSFNLWFDRSMPVDAVRDHLLEVLTGNTYDGYSSCNSG